MTLSVEFTSPNVIRATGDEYPPFTPPTNTTLWFTHTGLGKVFRYDLSGWIEVDSDEGISVMGFGAKGDGVTDDTQSFITAQAVLQAVGGGIVQVPAGTFMVSGNGVLNRADKTTFQGAGMWLTTIKARASMTALYQASNSFAGRGTQTFQDLCFDSNSLATNGVVIYGLYTPRTTFRRCRFTNLTTSGIYLSGTNGVTIEDCYFHNAGVPASSVAINVVEGCYNLRVRRNRFEYVSSGIQIDNGAGGGPNEEIAEHIDISDNYFDLGWWLLKSQASNSGGTVTYSGTVLTDTAAAFSGFSVGTNTNVRVMPVRRTGTITTTDNQELVDSGAAFTSYGIIRGEIVRSGTRWGVVSAVESDTKLRIEQWLDSTTYQPTTPPAVAATYTVYGIYIGEVTSFNATSITSPRWHDLDGTTQTPSAGALYEVMVLRCNYPIQSEYGTRNIRVSRNTLRRGWSDQISIFGTRAIVTDNQSEDGQDMGLTLHGERSVIANNRFIHNGAGGAYISSDDTIVSNNEFEGSQWENFVNLNTLGGIILDSANRCSVIGNIFDGQSLPQARYSIVVTGTSVDNLLALNKSRNVATFDYHLYGAGVTGTQLRDNQGTVGHGNSAVGGDYGTLTGTGTPEGAVTAGVGTLFRRTDSATSLYVKQTGTGNTGWVAK